MLESWKITENIIGICFDTTRAHDGWQNGAIVCLQKYLDKPLLLLALYSKNHHGSSYNIKTGGLLHALHYLSNVRHSKHREKW